MKNYLIRLYITDSDGLDHVDYHVIRANDLYEADNIADKISQEIIRTEHYDSNKHDYRYEGKYASAYSGVVTVLDDDKQKAQG
jgi:hypothetical protein